MTVSSIFVGAAIVTIVMETTVWILVRYFRPRFQWLITSADAAPSIDTQLINKYVKGSFDPRLGWVRKANTNGVDDTVEGSTRFRIDRYGRRHTPGFENLPDTVAVFGDSYAFCRMVEDDETWPHYLSQQLGIPVHNFGVGNYGLDQALLRFEQEQPSLAARVSILAVVPETMSRVHSYWKHYFEYGNILAFKPRFVFSDGKLALHKPAVACSEDLRTYTERLNDIQALDPFYEQKFCRDLFRFPFLWGLVSRPRRNAAILAILAWGAATGKFEQSRSRAFEVVIAENAKVTAKLYHSPQSCQLLEALISRYLQFCLTHKIQPMIVVIPQPVDLARRRQGHLEYSSFFADQIADIEVVDLTDDFLGAEEARLYVHGSLGSHVSSAGNRLIAEKLREIIQSKLEDADQQR